MDATLSDEKLREIEISTQPPPDLSSRLFSIGLFVASHRAQIRLERSLAVSEPEHPRNVRGKKPDRQEHGEPRVADNSSGSDGLGIRTCLPGS